MRKSSIQRNTKETKIKVSINLDGNGKYQVKTGIGFFDYVHGQVGMAINGRELHPIFSIVKRNKK